MTISPAASIWCSASPASASGRHWRSSSACPNSDVSAASKSPRSPALLPSTTTAENTKEPRHIAGGRGRLRRSLFAAALPAAFRWNKALVALYARLTARGKAHKAALIACARKLLIYANTVVAARHPLDRKSHSRLLMVATKPVASR